MGPRPRRAPRGLDPADPAGTAGPGPRPRRSRRTARAASAAARIPLGRTGPHGPGRSPARRPRGGPLMLLGIDTSGAVSVAVARGDLPGPGGTDDTGGPTAGPEILAVRVDARSRHHDEVLLELIDTVVAEAGATRGDLTGVIAGRGPG